MKKSGFLLFFLAMVAFAASAQKTLQQNIDSLAAAYLQSNSGALVIGININSKETIYYYGETAKGNKQTADSNSIFEIGELTETFTCLLYADMTLKGIIHGDDRLQSFIPLNIPVPVYQKLICKRVDEIGHNQLSTHEPGTIYFTPYTCFPDPNSKPQEIMLCDLATHTTGLPQYPVNLKLKKNKDNPFAKYSENNLYDFLKKYHFENPMGYDYKHSSTGIALLGKALTIKAKANYDTLLNERLCAPIGLLNTRVNLTHEQQLRLIEGHDLNGNKVNHWTYDVMAPAGGLHSSINDMMKFLTLNITEKKNYYTDLFDYSHNPRIELQGKKDKNKAIALGWKINPIENESRLVWQSGVTGGFASYIGFVEAGRIGVVILSSSAKDVVQTGEQILKAIEQNK